MRRSSRRTFLKHSLLAGCAGGLILKAPTVATAVEIVDLQLILAIDCSYSVDAREYNLQIGAIGDALNQPEIIAAISEGPLGSIAISIVQWSYDGSQIEALPWTKVDQRSAPVVGARIAALPRLTLEGATSMSAAVDYARSLFNRSPYQSPRRTIDLAADGRNNNGPYMPDARDRATAAGITINGLAILLEDRTLDVYFKRDVIGGPGAFVEKATDYQDFRRAMRRKLLREIRHVPVA